jgi:hypothetical protein
MPSGRVFNFADHEENYFAVMDKKQSCNAAADAWRLFFISARVGKQGSVNLNIFNMDDNIPPIDAVK